MSTFSAAEARTPSDLTLQGLYERHAERIFGFCRRRLRSHEEAEDAVQETFMSAMRALQRGSVPVCETAWLFKIAENTCISVYRSRARRDASSLADIERVERLPARAEDGDSLFGLEDALAAIPERQRRAFLLRELRGLSYLEIAEQLGVSVASVETLIYRARRGLARALETGAGFRGRLTAGLNLGSIVAAAKSLFAGTTALKVASTAAVVAVAVVSTGDTAQQGRDPLPAPASSTVAPKNVNVRSSAVWGAPRDGEPAVVGRARSLPTSVSGRPLSERKRAAPTPATVPALPAAGEAPPADAELSKPGTGGSTAAPLPQPSPAASSSPPAPPAPAPAPAAPAQVPPVPPVTLPGLVDPVIETTLPQVPQLPELPQLPQLPGAGPDPASLLPALPQLP